MSSPARAPKAHAGADIVRSDTHIEETMPYNLLPVANAVDTHGALVVFQPDDRCHPSLTDEMVRGAFLQTPGREPTPFERSGPFLVLRLDHPGSNHQGRHRNQHQRTLFRWTPYRTPGTTALSRADRSPDGRRPSPWLSFSKKPTLRPRHLRHG